MSRQSKAAKKKAFAKQITALHLKGEKGPSKTQRKHTKKYENTLAYKRSVAARARQMSLAEQALQ